MITIVLSALIFIPLIISTIRGKLKPHPITWLVLTLSGLTNTLIMFFNDAGPGAWGVVTGVIFAFILTIVAFINYRKTSRISQLDILFFFLAIVALILWLISRDFAVISVILLTATSVFGMVPTFVKTWKEPRSESFYTWSVLVSMSIFGIAATEHFDFVNLFRRTVSIFHDGAVILIMIIRRRKVPEDKELVDKES
ncbi:hypothetical protein FWG95_04300 [Candidatus Saccharibacteria bacterium]|nr:hypothetical protein [Candidatus Saccharibacteria bacterium]